MSRKSEQPELSATLFLTTALQLAEQSGDIQKLSLRNLGKALGVDPTAVYRYFPSKADLVDAMIQRLMLDFFPNDEEMKGDWRVRLTALAQRARLVFFTYPSVSIQLPSSPYARTPVVDRLTEIGYAALKEAGLSDEHVVLFHDILYTFALGMGQCEAQYEENLDAEAPVMPHSQSTLSSEDFPNVYRLARLMDTDSDVVFQLILDIYLMQSNPMQAAPLDSLWIIHTAA